LNQNAHDLIEM